MSIQERLEKQMKLALLGLSSLVDGVSILATFGLYDLRTRPRLMGQEWLFTSAAERRRQEREAQDAQFQREMARLHEGQAWQHIGRQRPLAEPLPPIQAFPPPPPAVNQVIPRDIQAQLEAQWNAAGNAWAQPVPLPEANGQQIRFFHHNEMDNLADVLGQRGPDPIRDEIIDRIMHEMEGQP